MNCIVEIGEQLEHTVHEYDFGVVHLTTFYCKLISGTPQLTEHASILWLRAEELNTAEWAPADIPAINAEVFHYGTFKINQGEPYHK